MELRPYQIDTVEKVLQAYQADPHGHAKAVLATGLGKTIIFSSVAHKIRAISDTNVLIIAHRDELLNQAAEKYRLIEPSAIIGKVGGGNHEWGAPVTVASIQTISRAKYLKQLQNFKYGLVIVDECFPAGTLIDGKPIETIKTGDMVTAFDESTQAFTQKKVVRTFRKLVGEFLIRITSNSHTIVCTPNHPFYTSSGWKQASQITTGEMILHGNNGPLHSMPTTFSAFSQSENQMETRPNNSLQQPGMQKQIFFSNNGQNQSEICQHTYENQQSNEQARNKRESASFTQGKRTQTNNSGREWQGSNDSATNVSKSLELADGICGCNTSNEGQSTALSNLLQNRHCQCNIENSNRNRRRFSHVVDQKSTGSEKNTISNWARVDSVEIYEQRSTGTFRNLCPDGYVYNFEVEDLHTYIANGFVVHNCHHAHKKNEYGKVLTALPEAFKFGVTATDMRLDKRSNDDIFGEAIVQYGIKWGIAEGYLCDLRAIAIKTKLSLDEIKRNRLNDSGELDFNQNELARAIDTPLRNKRVVDAWKEHAQNRKTICFGVTVKHAEHIVEAFAEQGVTAAVVSGETPHHQRQTLYAALADSSLSVLCTVQVLTEGFDLPALDCIILARPTQSTGLYMQCVGRGTRLFPGKTDCLILDLTDNVKSHKLEPVNLSKALVLSMYDGESVNEAEERKKRENDERQARIRKLKEERSADVHVDLFQPEQQQEPLLWEERVDGMFVLEVGREKHRIALVPTEDGDCYDVWARLFPGYEAQRWAVQQPFLRAQQIAETKARMLQADPKAISLVDRTAAWRAHPVDPLGGQVKFLKWKGIPWSPDMTKGEASDLIDAWKERDEHMKKVIIRS